MTSDRLIQNRFEELAKRSSDSGCYTYSEFLTLAEQDTLYRMKLTSPIKLDGGFEGAERKIACFGSMDYCGYEENVPISCLCIAPVSQKFAEELTHRDFLGALMGLGIKREVLGDIIVKDNCAYLFCLEPMAEYIKEHFSQVKRTTVIVARTEELPAATSISGISQIVVASERLDAIIAAVYGLSRSESQKLFEQERVLVNSRIEERSEYKPNAGNMISVRGFGRFFYEGMEKETRKGKLRVNVRIQS